MNILGYGETKLYFVSHYANLPLNKFFHNGERIKVKGRVYDNILDFYIYNYPNDKNIFDDDGVVFFIVYHKDTMIEQINGYIDIISKYNRRIVIVAYDYGYTTSLPSKNYIYKKRLYPIMHFSPLNTRKNNHLLFFNHSYM